MKIKIICTLGPSSFKENVIKKFKALGVDLYRINMSHTSLNILEKKIKFLKNLRIKNICIDTEGAQVRSKCEAKTFLKKGTLIKISNNKKSKYKTILSFYPKFDFNLLKKNTKINIGFNNLSLKIVKIMNTELLKAEVISEGILETNKGVHFSNYVNLPYLTEKDKKAILIAKKNSIKYFALSFANFSEDVSKLRDFIGERSFLISKIETKNGVLNLNSIQKKSNAILIDRGDLSRYVKYEKIPIVQEYIIKQAVKNKKQIFVATNLLESMIDNHSPTRAESHDIHNTLIQGANGLVLAAETAIGKHPIDVIKYIVKSINIFKKQIKQSKKLKIFKEEFFN